ncbi:5-(carboxyamino)imidazole ribonucleotide synthase [Euhalothece natronophila Z-M001]|uniref:N5-carboxyaminoimidazole ribonucleotide synthase n=1 Tax=Euhalothece natronophila Z-M001 TaxID=522448 RepID=A0A5B8NLE1_9CHRO|nr:5-(carboxyamino)imidazole ribonucleotide synthase [Euhalothece natronophila]QDZ38959.1 5-(carboxyamino)imidazole ribonucleotide synthase [Euhalothece natronophila Z-M001]
MSIKKRVGVIGGGQLAWMMGLEASSLGVSLRVQTPNFHDPAVAYAEESVIASLSDLEATRQLAQSCDVITFENEFIDLAGLSRLREEVDFYPSLNSLAPLLDKFEQRCYLQELGIPVPVFKTAIAGEAQFEEDEFPLVIKARRHGYDGQGTFIVETDRELTRVWETLKGLPVLVEECIPFEKELAVMAARGVNGETVVYPVTETYQQDQVCQRVIAPARISEALEEEIRAIAQSLLTALNWVGVFGIEFFLTDNERVLVNEVAPRTHNSGHYTLDACDISQFAMHLKAVTGDTLTPPQMKSEAAVMVNLLGYETLESDYAQQREKLQALPHTHLYWYGKTQARPGRKLGHVTILEKDITKASAIADQVSAIWDSHDKG